MPFRSYWAKLSKKALAEVDEAVISSAAICRLGRVCERYFDAFDGHRASGNAVREVLG
jgi:hypothetical protein